MQRNSGYLSILIGVSILVAVALGLGGIAYSFYRSEMAQVEEESLDMANDDSPFEQSKQEPNTATTPVPEETSGGSGEIMPPSEGIPTGTYSNPPTTIKSSSSDSSSSTEINRNPPLNNFDSSLDSSIESNRLRQKSLTDSPSDFPDYSRPSSSNSFNSSSDNSLIEPLDDSDLLEAPTAEITEPSETPSLSEPSLLSEP
jgi:hypothetical protein